MRKINNNFNAISTVKGRIKKTINYNDINTINYGRFYSEKTKGFYIEYTDPEHIIFTYNHNIFSVYSEENKHQFVIPLQENNIINPSTLASLNFFYPNILDIFKNDFMISVIDSTENSIILQFENLMKKAAAKNVLIKISRRDFLIQALEIFNEADELYYQLLYGNYQKINQFKFPLELSLNTIKNDELYSEEIKFERIEINEIIPNKYFELVAREGIKTDTLKLN
ncbi:outer membrane lipoprotein carrier protein LolA [candidate division KSB1 bacterium]